MKQRASRAMQLPRAHEAYFFWGCPKEESDKVTERRGAANPAFCHAVAAVAATQR